MSFIVRAGLVELSRMLLDGGGSTKHAANELMRDIHARNVAAGWWTDINTGLRKERNVGEILALMHSEVSEAWTATGKDEHLPQYENRDVELADMTIRGFDAAAAFAPDMPAAMVESVDVIRDMFGKYGMSSLAYELCHVHADISRALEAHRKGRRMERHLADAIARCFFIGADRGGVIFTAFADKIMFNAQRADHKIENRLKADGKKI